MEKQVSELIQEMAKRIVEVAEENGFHPQDLRDQMNIEDSLMYAIADLTGEVIDEE